MVAGAEPTLLVSVDGTEHYLRPGQPDVVLQRRRLRQRDRGPHPADGRVGPGRRGRRHRHRRRLRPRQRGLPPRAGPHMVGPGAGARPARADLRPVRDHRRPRRARVRRDRRLARRPRLLRPHLRVDDRQRLHRERPGRHLAALRRVPPRRLRRPGGRADDGVAALARRQGPLGRQRRAPDLPRLRRGPRTAS